MTKLLTLNDLRAALGGARKIYTREGVREYMISRALYEVSQRTFAGNMTVANIQGDAKRLKQELSRYADSPNRLMVLRTAMHMVQVTVVADHAESVKYHEALRKLDFTTIINVVRRASQFLNSVDDSARLLREDTDLLNTLGSLRRVMYAYFDWVTKLRNAAVLSNDELVIAKYVAEQKPGMIRDLSMTAPKLGKLFKVVYLPNQMPRVFYIKK